jgi:hypothetical protein
MFDVIVVDELRAWPTERLLARHHELVRARRRLELEDLDVMRVLDERGQIDATVGRDGESARTVRQKLETARALESLPATAAAAREGLLSGEQLAEVVKFADEESDAEWAQRAQHVDPAELARIARNASKPTRAESQARFAARSLRTWWNPDKTMLSVRGELPDVMGVEFEATITKLADRLGAPKGQVWDSFEHRAADALLLLCNPPEPVEEHQPSLGARPVIQVLVRPHGPAEIAGVPIADALLEQLRANASIELVLVDDDEQPITIGKRSPGLSPKIARAVMLRDGQCRMPGCARRRGLEVHHLVPRSAGGSDDISNLAVVCPTHHRLLIPHGSLALVGNPNQPDGLELLDTRERPPP